MWRLKANVPDFTVVDGPFANRTYRAGERYDAVPVGEEWKFDRVQEEQQQNEVPQRRGRWNSQAKDEEAKDEGEGGKGE